MLFDILLIGISFLKQVIARRYGRHHPRREAHSI